MPRKGKPQKQISQKKKIKRAAPFRLLPSGPRKSRVCLPSKGWFCVLSRSLYCRTFRCKYQHVVRKSLFGR